MNAITAYTLPRATVYPLDGAGKLAKRGSLFDSRPFRTIRAV